MADIVGGLKGLFDNKLFLQLLAAGGADLMQNTGGHHLGGAIQQNIASQNYAKLLAKMLGGEIPEGGKVTMDDKGVKMELPKTATLGQSAQVGPTGGVAGQLFGSSASRPPTVPMSPATPQDYTSSMGWEDKVRMLGGLSPFGSSQSGVSPSDLAGLSPQDIASALQFKFGKEEMEQRRINDLLDAMYKGGMLSVAERHAGVAERGAAVEEAGIPIREMAAETDRLNAIRQLADEFRVAPIEVPGLGQIDLKEWNALDTKTKAYSFYVFDQKANRKAPLTYEAWERQNNQATIEQYYERSKDDPDFKKFLFELTERGATRITLGEKLEEIKAKSELAGQLAGQEYFAQVDWPQKLYKEVSDDEAISNEIFRNRDNPQRQAQIVDERMVEKIKERIKAGRGVITGYSVDPASNSITWTVRWPSGKEEPIVYTAK